MSSNDPVKGSGANNKHDYGQMSVNAQNDTGDYAGDYQTQIDELSAKIERLVSTQVHDGNKAPLINFNTEITGLFETVSAIPTGVPKNPYDQVKIYVNSTTYRLYWYDAVGAVWHYVAATA